MSDIVLENFMREGLIEAGCDEAGRGCLAGPVFAAAVILPSDFYHPLLNDSKKLSERTRNLLRPIIELEAIAYCVATCSPAEIDELNILNASILAMQRALEGLAIIPEHILIDGNRFKQYGDIAHTCVVGGDGKYMSIAAASILAKTWRDSYMRELAKEFPQYGWERNMAYPTKEHRTAIAEFGPSSHHRMTFRF